MNRLTPLVLIAVNLVLVFALIGQWVAPDAGRWSPPPSIAPHTLPSGAPPTASAYPAGAQDAQEVRARPLFSASRRPAEETDAAVNRPDALRLIGLFQTDQTAGAIVMTDGRAQRLRVGEAVGALELLRLSDDEAIFSGPNGEERRLILQRRHLSENQAPAAGDRATAPVADEALDD